MRVAVEALYDAADDDTATGGPDLVRRIFPIVVTITAPNGAVQLPDERPRRWPRPSSRADRAPARLRPAVTDRDHDTESQERAP